MPEIVASGWVAPQARKGSAATSALTPTRSQPQRSARIPPRALPATAASVSTMSNPGCVSQGKPTRKLSSARTAIDSRTSPKKSWPGP